MKILLKLCLSMIMAWTFTAPARADLIVNGGFESGFSSWTRANQVGSEGTFALQSGTLSPVNAITVPAPPGGTFAAMTDAEGPGSHVLYQDFTVLSPLSTALLTFDLFIGNRAGRFDSPATLDFATATLNQQARVDILLASANPFSVAPSDVLLNVYQTKTGDPLVSGYTPTSQDVSAILNTHLNQQLRLRFSEVDNEFIFQLGVDNVHIQESAQVVPEPSYWVITFVGVLAIFWLRRRTAQAG